MWVKDTVCEELFSQKSRRPTTVKKFRIRRDLDASDGEDINWIEEVNGVIETYPNSDHVYIDTCASAGLFILSVSIYFSSISKIDGVIGLTAAGAAMTKDGVGIAGCRENVTLCMTARRNILSEDRLQSQGYGLWLIGKIQIVRLHDSSVVLVGERVNGMPRFCLQDVLDLPRLDTTGELVCFRV